MDRVAMLVAENLELDVSGPGEVFFHVDLAVAERGERFRSRQLERAREIVCVLRDAHALAAAPSGRFDDDREADLARESQRLFRILHGTRRARDDRHADVGHRLTSGRLVAHHTDLLGCRPDEGNVGGGAGLGELRVLGQEPVSGMDGIGAGDLGGGDQTRDSQIRFARRRRPDADVIVGEPHVQRFAVGFRVHGDGLDPQLAARANHAQRDLSAIRD
jgi:hypothetical protein